MSFVNEITDDEIIRIDDFAMMLEETFVSGAKNAAKIFYIIKRFIAFCEPFMKRHSKNKIWFYQELRFLKNLTLSKLKKDSIIKEAKAKIDDILYTICFIKLQQGFYEDELFPKLLLINKLDTTQQISEKDVYDTYLYLREDKNIISKKDISNIYLYLRENKIRFICLYEKYCLTIEPDGIEEVYIGVLNYETQKLNEFYLVPAKEKVIIDITKRNESDDYATALAISVLGKVNELLRPKAIHECSNDATHSHRDHKNSIKKSDDDIKVYTHCDGVWISNSSVGPSRGKGSQKAPHTRIGHYRYNPRTGKKDIFVKSSIIHKEEYRGYNSCVAI